MRYGIGLAAVAFGATVAAQPALAEVPGAAVAISPLSVSADLAPALPASVAAVPVFAAPFVPALAGIPALATALTPSAALPDFRLHALASTAAARAPLDDQAGRLRRGWGGAMGSFFPGADGFHLSAGTRFWNRGPRASSLDTPYARLLYAPRAVLTRATRRMTPALTMGYSRLVATGLTLGVEGGAMLGKFDSLAGALVRPPSLRGPGLGDGAGRLNQVARMTVGWHF